MAAMDRSVPAEAGKSVTMSKGGRVRVRSCDAPTVPAWARGLAPDEASADDHTSEVMPGLEASMTITRGADAALVSVSIDGVDEWSPESFHNASRALVRLSLEGLLGTGFEHAVRLWNFLPGICELIEGDLDRYRVFNIARHREFEQRFGTAALRDGSLPTASCVGHAGRSIAVHALGAREASRAVENPRQVPAYSYSNKYGPKPPSFSRAGIASFGSRRMLLIAGTASVLGEDSVHDGSLRAQCDETLVNLRAVAVAGKKAAGLSGTSDLNALNGLCATRVYHRRSSDLAWLSDNLDGSLVGGREVEFVRADVCRDELLVEIEAAIDLSADRGGIGARG